MRPRSSPRSMPVPLVLLRGGPREKWRPLKARPSSGDVQLLIKRVHSRTSSAGQKKKQNRLHKLNLMGFVLFCFFGNLQVFFFCFLIQRKTNMDMEESIQVKSRKTGNEKPNFLALSCCHHRY